MGPYGRQWFALTLRDPSEFWRGAVAAREALDHFLDAECARLGVDPARLVLVGFSQGTMMALHCGLRRKVPPAAIIGYSGLLPGPEHLSEITGRPQVLLVHGTADQVLPVEQSRVAAAALTAVGVPVRLHLSPGVGHGIDQTGLRLGAETIAAALTSAGRRDPQE